ncbi:signal transducer and transcription activator isoform X2 [Drosophila willistoni]|uniref:signal transducer and transcription activator isoform X2 n=1 Tax=Drosophila willistoni TaxID=7260 RepID=UPI000C26D3AD|nr:signal transducer and transcription activator isoform X2 [Drosophila willistoni]XP_023035559.1 signal transducer and transcription activator isoform X2 [Drosophila willistoni]
MSLWKRISSHADCEQRMAAYYDEKGLFDLRLCLAPWIEDRIMSEQITPNSTEQLERIALKFNEDLQQKLLSTRTATDQNLKYRVVELCALIQRTPALELYTHLRSGLQKELQFVTEQSVAATGGQSMPLNPYNMNNPAAMAAAAGFINDGSQLMDSSSNGGGGFVAGGVPVVGPGAATPSMGGGGGGGVVMGHNATPAPAVGMGVVKMELYDLHQQIMQAYNDFSSIGNPLKMMVHTYECMIQVTGAQKADLMRSVIEQKANIVCHLRRSFMYYEALQEMAVTELKNWRRQQAQAGNGASFNENMLDEIQRCFGILESFVCLLLEAVKQVRMMEEDQELKIFMETIQVAQKNLVCSAFIVDKQPPQVMKTNTRFASSVRWLIGSQLGIHNNPPTVECIIMSEQQAQRFVTRGSHMDVINNSMSNQSSGEIQNCSSTMEYQQNQIFSASFRNMQLKKIKRAEKKGTESVMDEKFALFFYATTTVDSYQIRVWTLSLPVVVIVHGNQEPQSWATITWDNAFADIVRDPFVVTDRVTWCQLSIALNIKFGSSTQRPLTSENLEFLFEKLQRDNISGERNDCISWNHFCKEPLPDRAFTFWEWFYAIMKLTKDHLLGMWKAGRITGFISKAKAQDDLMRATTGIGTFLVRFSDSELGAVSIAYVNEYGVVVMLKPWTSKDFHIINLADRIRDLDLRYLHPTDINVLPLERDIAFGEFYTPRVEPAPRPDGYVPSTIRVQVRAAGGENGSIAGTPHHPMQSPPQNDMTGMGNGNNDFAMADFDAMQNFDYTI